METMTLYQLDAAIRDFAFEVDPETGEILNAAELDTLNMERNVKLENVALYIKNLLAEAAAIKVEEDALKKRREVSERNAERLKSYLADSLQGDKLSTPRVAITYRKTTRVEIDNQELAISSLQNGGYTDALRYKPPEISKKEVKKLIDGGASIPGVRIENTKIMAIK